VLFGESNRGTLAKEGTSKVQKDDSITFPYFEEMDVGCVVNRKHKLISSYLLLRISDLSGSYFTSNVMVCWTYGVKLAKVSNVELVLTHMFIYLLYMLSVTSHYQP